MKTALIVVDVQNDFTEGGALPVSGGATLASRIARYAVDMPFDFVVTTQDMHLDPGSHFSDEPNFVTTWPRHCVLGTRGADLRKELDSVDFDAHFVKGKFSAAYSGFEAVDTIASKPLGMWLTERAVTKVTVVGIATDHCVAATVIDALLEELEVTVPLELTVPVSEQGGIKAVKEMRAAGARIQ